LVGSGGVFCFAFCVSDRLSFSCSFRCVSGTQAKAACVEIKFRFAASKLGAGLKTVA